MTAIISPCGRYRYRLERTFGMVGQTVAFFGINPSTADAETDDQTTRKWLGFAKRWGAARYIVGNVFAWRATKVGSLADVEDPIGPENAHHVRQIIADADLVVPCWGNRGKVPKRLRPEIDELARLITALPKPVRILGTTKGGDPLHVQMLGYDTPLVEWYPSP